MFIFPAPSPAAHGSRLADGGSTAVRLLMGDFIAGREGFSLGICAESQPDPGVGRLGAKAVCEGCPAGGSDAAKGQRCCWGRSSQPTMLPGSAEQGLAVPLVSSALRPQDTEVLGVSPVSGWGRPQCCGSSGAFG